MTQKTFQDVSIRLSRAFNAVDAKIVVGGLDASLDQVGANTLGRVWSVHAWCLAYEFSDEQVTRLRQLFPASAVVQKPILVKAFDGNPAGLAYAFKSHFVLRVTKRSRGTGRSRQNTWLGPLPSKAHAELLIALDRLGLAERVVSHSLKILPGTPLQLKESARHRVKGK
jgi:hypothetical protein